MTHADGYHVLYLTGAPATGKTTLMEGLHKAITPVIAFSYSKELAAYVGQREQRNYSQDDMRKHSAGVITAQDVVAVDEMLLTLVHKKRKSSHIVIDSHAVTKERYGFRVIPFSSHQISALKPTLIVVLFAASDVVVDRISKNPEGRPIPSTFEATLHTELQATVAIGYGIQLGVPVHFVNSGRPREELLAEVSRLLGRQSRPHDAPDQRKTAKKIRDIGLVNRRPR